MRAFKLSARADDAVVFLRKRMKERATPLPCSDDGYFHFFSFLWFTFILAKFARLTSLLAKFIANFFVKINPMLAENVLNLSLPTLKKVKI